MADYDVERRMWNVKQSMREHMRTAQYDVAEEDRQTLAEIHQQMIERGERGDSQT